MTNHHGENWPYHENRNGDMVACASNPCRIHGGSDIIATSPEEAARIRYDGIEPSGMSSSHEMTVDEVKTQQDTLNERLHDYAPHDWNGWHLEKVNGGQYNAWQGDDYRKMNRHLDEIDQDQDIDDRTRDEYKRFIADTLDHDNNGISVSASSLPVRFLLNDDARNRASSFSIPTHEGYMSDTTSLLHHGLGRGSVASMHSLSLMFAENNDNNPISIANASRISTKEWGGSGDSIILDASTKKWGEFSFDESINMASRLPSSWGEDNINRSSIERVREWGQAAASSDGYAEHISSESLHSFGVDNGDAIMKSMKPEYYHTGRSSQVDERDIRAISRRTPKEIFSQAYTVNPHDDASLQQARKRSLERKEKRCRAIFRCTAIADRLYMPVQRVYRGLLRDAEQGGTAIDDIMKGDVDRGTASVMRIFDFQLDDMHTRIRRVRQ